MLCGKEGLIPGDQEKMPCGLQTCLFLSVAGYRGSPGPSLRPSLHAGQWGRQRGLAAWLPSCDLMPVTLGHVASSSGNRGYRGQLAVLEVILASAQHSRSKLPAQDHTGLGRAAPAGPDHVLALRPR